MTVVRPEPMGSELAISASQSTFSPAQRAALAHAGVENAPDADVQVFFHVCQRSKLDPFAKQIYMIGRQESENVNGEWVKKTKYTIQTAIDGFRLIARRVADETGHELAYGDTMWCGADGVWHDVWLGEPGDLRAAKATVYRAGKSFTHVALFREYVQTKRNGEPNTMWATKGANQLAKCAEAGALRKAFPQDLCGLYVDAEMDHAANEATAANTVRGGRDWYADAAGARSEAELRRVWSEANRARQLDDPLKQFIQARRADLAKPQPAEHVDPETGEVHEAELVEPNPPAVEPQGPRPLTRTTGNAVLAEFKRLGVGSAEVDAWLPAVGVPVGLRELSQPDAEELFGVLKNLDRDRLAELAREAQGQ